MKLTPHFDLAELACKDGSCVPDRFIGNATRLCGELEVLRVELGRPVVITSGYRSPEWNAARGAEKSQHLTASAADIRVANVPPRQVHAAIERLIGAGKMRDGGLGLYLPREGRAAGWVHYDVGPAGRRWRG